MNEVNLGVEQILAATLHKMGPITLTPTELMTDYSQFAVAVDPDGDDIKFSLVDLQGVDLEELSE